MSTLVDENYPTLLDTLMLLGAMLPREDQIRAKFLQQRRPRLSPDSVKRLQKVLVRDSEGNVLKRGVVVGITTSGVNIYDPKDKADRMEWAEWFGFRSKMTSIHAQ